MKANLNGGVVMDFLARLEALGLELARTNPNYAPTEIQQIAPFVALYLNREGEVELIFDPAHTAFRFPEIWLTKAEVNRIRSYGLNLITIGHKQNELSLTMLNRAKNILVDQWFCEPYITLTPLALTHS